MILLVTITLVLCYFAYKKITTDFLVEKQVNTSIYTNQIDQQSRENKVIEQQKQEDKQSSKTYNSYSLRDQRYDNNVTMNSDGTKHYRNERYGLEFDFPSEWIAREPAYGSVNMEFNMELYIPDKAGLHPIQVGAFPKGNGWIEGLLAYHKSTGEDKNYEKITTGGIDGYKFVSTGEGMSEIENLFSFGDYWLMIGGKVKYKDTLDAVLKSTKFFTPNYELR